MRVSRVYAWVNDVGVHATMKERPSSPTRNPNRGFVLLWGWSTLLLAAGCTMCEPPIDGHGPIAEGVGAPLGSPGPWATEEQQATFERGQNVAAHRFSREEGLGPAFNLTFCGGCHEKPTVGGGSGLYRNFFLTGVRTESGAFFPGESAGRSGGVIRAYYYGADHAARPLVPEETNVIAQRNGIPFYGVGLLAELPESEILVRADADDEDGDGISGKPNYDRGFVGRFGRKAQTVSIEGFIRGPLFNHMGITTDPLSEAQRARLPVDSSQASLGSETFGALQELGVYLAQHAQAAAADGPLVDEDDVPDPELSGDELFDLVSFVMLMAAPQPEELNDQRRRGIEVFDSIGCNKCHTPRLNGPKGPLAVYSDLLLHDMGPELADGLEMGEAEGTEYRTQPLWGLVATGPYLHDGRAHTIEEAILWHGGEAKRARDAYVGLADGERDDLHEFLFSLGGREQTSLGMIDLSAPVPAPGEYGGPRYALDDDDLERYQAGRILFDREFGLSEGVGAPRMNGDSCRACHFEPVFGGAGPRGVNVVRHALWDDESGFVSPAAGTILHKLNANDKVINRPEAETVVYEHRQTPHLFGLGMIEEIPEEALYARADPTDEDADGISGRVAIVDGNRVGRFGWKASIPSVAEFVRDAVSAELGMTLPPIDGFTFGITADDDDVADPEFLAEDAELLSWYLAMLGPPPKKSRSEPHRVEAGARIFDEVGCNKCHVPELPTTNGAVPLYSDLLLHDVMPEGARGIEEANAGVREFRTAPLWGLSETGPYLHSGEADTVHQAIIAHDGEARIVKEAYESLSVTEIDDLLYFLGSL